jgi:predicted acyltransferase
MKTISATQTSRLTSLDVFRGIIIAGMILVTDPGTYDAIYPQLRHADWMGATATDMISFVLVYGRDVNRIVCKRAAGPW